MPIPLANDHIQFPAYEWADEDGLLAWGGDLSVDRLLNAYRLGIFPWYSEGEPILWWCPDPRFVLLPEQLCITKSMQRVLNQKQFRITRNTAFSEVIRACSTVKRHGQHGTWLIPEMIAAYEELHRLGFAQSVEAWQDDQLVGGLYGIRLHNIFFGESMFSRVSNASKAAFITFVQEFAQEGGVLIDCQVHTEHLESLGASFISRDIFFAYTSSTRWLNEYLCCNNARFMATKAKNKKASPFMGTGVAVVTPFSRDGKIDFPALTKIVEHIIKGQCEYLVIQGTTGESPTLNREEKADVLKHVLELVNNRVPVVFGIGGNDTAEVVHQLETTNLIGVSGILSVAPYYSKPNQKGVYAHYKAVAEASPLPVILYNVPGRTVMNMTADTTLRLAHDFPRLVGIKEASGNMEQIMVILRDRPKDFLVISGDDLLTLPLLALGADGVISVVANAFPKRFSEMVRQGRAGNLAEARKLHESLIEVTQLFFADGNPGGVKEALEYMKLGKAHLRLPLYPVNESVRKAIQKATKKLR